jgi:HK97 gp10 family phage protein
VSNFTIKGGAELQRFLDQLPAKLEANVMRSALRQGAKLIADEAKAQAPVAPPNSENKRLYGGYEGALRDSIRVSTGLKKGKVTASVKAGGKKRKSKRGADVFYAHMVEFGTAAHSIKPTKKGGKKFLSFGGIFARSVEHPGAAPRPFMRPALDGKAGAAIVAVGAQIKKRLTKEGLNASDIEVEDEE